MIQRFLALLVLILGLATFYAEGVIQVDQGKVYVNFPGSGQWDLWQRDFELPLGSRLKTGEAFVGRVIFESGESQTLGPGYFYHLRENRGFYEEYQGQWRRIASAGDLLEDKRRGERFPEFGKSFGILNPQTVVRLTRPGQFERKVFDGELSLYPGDIVELPPGGKSQIDWWEGSQVNLKEGSVIEVGQDGLFLKEGAVFARIKSGNSSFEILTPDALVAVKGTEFEVSHQGDTQVRVFEGVVRWQDRKEGKARAQFLQQGEKLRFAGDSSDRTRVESFQVEQKPSYSGRVQRKQQIFQRPELSQEQKEIERISRNLQQARERGKLSLQEEQEFRNNFQRRARNLNLGLLDFLKLAARPGEDTEFRSLTGVKERVGFEKRSQDWREAQRRPEFEKAEFLKGRELSLGEESRKKLDLLQEREEDLSQRLRARIQKEEFDRRGNSERGNSLSANLQRSQELVTLRNFRNQKQLDLKRLENDTLRLKREKDLVSKRIEAIESSLLRFPDQRDRLRASLVAWRVQKRELEERQRVLNGRIRVARTALGNSQSRINDLLSGLRSKDLQASKFQNQSRRILGIR